MTALHISQVGGDHPFPAHLAARPQRDQAGVTASPSDCAGIGALPVLSTRDRIGTGAPSPTSSVPNRSAVCARCLAWDAALVDDSYVPEDLYGPEDLEDPGGPRFVSVQDLRDAELDVLLGRNRYSGVDDREWEEWHGADQDAAERELLHLEAPGWVVLPPGGALAAALEGTRPQVMSPMALIELLKAATRESGWVEALKVEAMASFYRQRQAEHAASPRPTQVDSKGRPIDPERSWLAEIALALGLSEQTVARRVAAALRLTGPLRATHTALKCGALTWGKALAISEATADLPDQAARAVEAYVLKRAATQTHKNLLESLRRQVAKHAAAKQADEHRAAAAERTCKIVPLANGMAGLWIVHTADKIQQIWVTIQAMATLAKRHGHTDTAGTNPPPSDQFAPSGSDAAPDAGTTDGAGPTGGADTTPAHATGGDSTPADTTPAPTDTGPAPASTPARPGPDTTDDPGDGAIKDAPIREHHQTDVTAEEVKDAGTVDGRHTDVTTERVKDTRTAEQRRADVTVDLFEHILRNGLDWLGRRLPDQHRRRPHIEVVVPATTLLGLDDDPAELTGYGPIPAEMARRIAADGTWRRLLTDPVNGMVLEASTTRHDPGTLVTETLLARHPVCAWPGCNRSSRDCDRDHTTPFAQTGQTSLTGLAPYCEYHHVIKDTPAWGWSSTSHPDGSITLTTPTGHRYTTVPPARCPIAQPPERRPIPHHAGASPTTGPTIQGSGTGPTGERFFNSAPSELAGGNQSASNDPPPF